MHAIIVLLTYGLYLPPPSYRLSSGAGDSSSEDEFYDRKEEEIYRKARTMKQAKAGKTEVARKAETPKHDESEPIVSSLSVLQSRLKFDLSVIKGRFSCTVDN